MLNSEDNYAKLNTDDSFSEPANLKAFKETMENDCQGIEIVYDRVKLAGTMFEIPSSEGENMETVDEITGVILYSHPAYAYYQGPYTGGNNPPDCSSFDGINGIGIPGGSCEECPYNRFGSGGGRSKMCKNKRMLYILRENELLPITLSLPTGSLKEYTNYVKSLLFHGKALSQVVTKFMLRRALSASGNEYSQVVFSCVRALSAEETEAVAEAAEIVKAYASNLTPAVMDNDNPFMDAENYTGRDV